MKKIAFIGVGNMGKPMAINLVKKGFSVSVFDVNPNMMHDCVAQGARASSSLGDAVKECECVVTMLPAAKHVEDIYMHAKENIFQRAPKEALLIDCSTISPQSAEKVATAATQQGRRMLCAPVSGGVGGATAGTLTFMIGGPLETLDRARPLFEAMGKNIFHAGESFTAGQAAKVCNNMLLAIHMIGSSEALNMGVNLGLDPKVLSEIMSKSSGRNWSLEVYNPYPQVQENVPSSKNYQGGFGVDLMLKDLGLAMDAAQSSRTQVPMGKKAFDLYQEHSQAGSGKLDFSSILKFLAERQTS